MGDLHGVDRVLAEGADRVHGFPGEGLVQPLHQRFVPQIRHAQAHGNIRGGTYVSAKAQGLLRDLIAHGVGAHRDRTVLLLADDGAAPQADGDHVGHTEVGAHAANGDRHAGLSGKSVLDDAQIRGRAAHIDHDGVFHPDQICRPADGVCGAAGDGQDGIAPGILHGHQRPVVLREVDLGVGHALFSQRLRKALSKRFRHLIQRRVQDGGVFPLDQAHGADLTGNGDMGLLPHDRAAQPSRLHLMVIADGGKHAGNGHRLDPGRLQLLKKSGGRSGIQRGQLLAVVLKAAADDSGRRRNALQIFRPVHHGRDPPGGRRADAQNADRGQILSLYDGVRALGSPQHGLPDLGTVHPGLLQDRADRGQNAVINIRGGVPLDRRHHMQRLVDQNSVRVGASHIDPELIHLSIPLCSALSAEYNRRRCRNTGDRPAPAPPGSSTGGSSPSPPP